jgi:hypothetical protein
MKGLELSAKGYILDNIAKGESGGIAHFFVYLSLPLLTLRQFKYMVKSMEHMSSAVFSAEQLKNKNSEDVQKILAISFEYLLTGIAEAYCQEKNIDTIEKFNRDNKLSWDQLLVHPFFISLSNGHSEALFSLFGPFYSFGFGPASTSIYELIVNKAEFENFEIDIKDTPIKVTAKNTSKEFKDIREDIQGHTIIFNQERRALFSKLEIVKDDQTKKPLYAAIDNGIDIIKRQSQNKKPFFSASLEQILFHASYFPAYWKGYSENSVEELTYDQVRYSKRPFYEDNSTPKRVVELCY